jgi:hypothetical protein
MVSDAGILDHDSMLIHIKYLSTDPELMIQEAQTLSIQADVFKIAIKQILQSI